MANYHSLKVEQIINETADAVSIVLEVPETLKEAYNYTPGQYLSFKKTIQGEELVRAYSLCSAPFENEWKVTVKRIENGRFSSFATQELKVGDSLEVMVPEGNFTTTIKKEQQKKDLIY